MVLEEDRLRREHALTNAAKEKRRAKRLRDAEQKAPREKPRPALRPESPQAAHAAQREIHPLAAHVFMARG